jgi:amino acid transporter
MAADVETSVGLSAEKSADDAKGHLKRGVLGHLSVLGQSVGAVGPSIGAAAFMPLAVLYAGDGSWVAVLIATVGILAVGIAISYLATHYRSPGALYTFVPRALRLPGAGFLMAGVGLLLGLAAASICFVGFGLYLSQFLGSVHIGNIPISGQLAYLSFPALAVAVALTLGDIRLSTRVLLACELASMFCISVLLIIVLVHHGHVFSGDVLGAHGSSFHGIILGMVFFVLAFGGFESATSLGTEANEAHRTIPFALIASVLVVGLFLTANAYIQVLGFQGTGQSLATQAAPLNTLADMAGVGWLGDIILLGVTVSFFAALQAYLNYTSRMVYAIGRDGLLPKAVTRVNQRTGSPQGAVVLVAAILVVMGIVVMAGNDNKANAFGYFSTIDGYCFTLVYMLASVAALVYALRKNRKILGVIVAAIIGGGVMLAEFYYSFIPMPTGPTRTIIILFGAVVVALIIGYLVLRAVKPSVAIRAGMHVEDAGAAPREPLPAVLASYDATAASNHYLAGWCQSCQVGQ